jgi:hypothetical protein
MFIAPLIWFALAQGSTVPLTGTVVGPGGKPVVGADLILVGLPSYDPPVISRGKSGEGGRFSLDHPANLAGDHDPQRAPILWAVKPGFRLSTTRFPEALPKPDDPVRVVLETPGKAEVRVERPDGQPLQGARVLPQWLKTYGTTVPDAVADLASATTGPDGLAVLDSVSSDELTYVDIHSPQFGIQGRPIVTKPGKPALVALRPVSTWKGRLSAQDAKHAQGWRVKAWTRVGGRGPNESPETTGYVETTTDEAGRFALAPIALGGLQLELKPPGDLPVLPDVPQNLAVREGREDSVEIPLKAGATVTGLFLERGTGKPVPGVSVTLFPLDANRNGNQTVKTDAHGRFTFQSLPGQVRVIASFFPATHVSAPNQGWDDFTVPEPPKVVELATREALPAAPLLRGQVVDEAGRAVPEASIEANWLLSGGRGSSSGRINTRADEKGSFVLEGLGPDSTVTMTARFRDRKSRSPVQIRAGEPGVVSVSISPARVLAVAGRVLGPAGVPLDGVLVKVQIRVPRDDFAGFPKDARFDGNPEIRTGRDGSFKAPKELDREPGEFRIEVAADGFLPARTAWVAAPEADLLTLPDLTLKRSRGTRHVSGRALDRDGKPVPRASVSQAGNGPSWTSATADAEGRFRLSGVAGGEVLVFAEAPGFRFGGTIVGAVGDAVEIRLARTSEPPIAALKLKTVPPPLSRAEERALALKLLEPLLPLARSGTLGNGAPSVFPVLARVAPSRVLDMIENRAIAEPLDALKQVALGQLEDDPALAIRTIDDDRDPFARASAWLAMSDFRPPLDRARQEQLLDRALTDARQSANIGWKVWLFGEIADRWLDLGSLERARPILLEGQRILAGIPKQTWVFEAEKFADVLAVIDLPAATALFERQGKRNVSPTDAATINGHKGQAAIRLANINPAEAERLIAPPSANFYERPAVVMKVARKMASADLARARRLIETIDDESSPGMTASRALVPFGLGAIAGELVKTNPAQARALLDEAFAGLRAIAIDGSPGQGQQSVANLMAELLPVVERVGPERLAERAWLAAASRSALELEPKGPELESTFALAMLVARYDRALADVIARADLERLPDVLGDQDGMYGNSFPTIFKCLTAYNPGAITPLLNALPESARKPPPKYDTWSPGSIESQIRLAAAQMLGVPSAARSREAGRMGDATSPYRLDD